MPTSFEIRRAGAADVETVRTLVLAAYAKWVPVIGREPMPMKADYERAVVEHRIDLLEIDGRVMGLIETIVQPDCLWIENVAVRPAEQGQGFGRRLLDHAEREALKAGRAKVRLSTNGAFEANIAIYGKLGFATDRREPFMGGIAVYMSKRLGG